MASIKEIRTHIKSVEQTLKITNAMYLISSSNLRKARKQLNDVEPYFQKIDATICDILHQSPEIRHCYFDKREHIPAAQRKAGYIVITADKGLAGAYNHNVLKLAEAAMAKSAQPTLFLVGQVGRAYFTQKDVTIDGEFLYTAQDPTLFRAQEISDIMLRLFQQGMLDDVYMIFTEMESPLHMVPKKYKLLPLDEHNFPQWKNTSDSRYQQTVSYVPSPDAVLSHIVPGYVKGMIFGGLVESYCSEQNARMQAMDSSTKNAKELLKQLSLVYNRARQSAITQEITEVVGGAQASLQS